MKREQIKELARAVAEADAMSDKELDWLFLHFTKKELKIFINLLFWEVKNRKVTVSYAGALTEEDKKRIISLFVGKRAEFKEDASLAAGVKFEYGDYVLDYSISGIINKILENIRENL
ncbi:MAG: F0F1 ATP synthase subunit delta [Endomicrobium sp.]|jgi:F-type H+-transporting ATPase subunit delta|nr:F0F1 ATP synthase subunit delta [Endomicrobium sp.]